MKTPKNLYENGKDFCNFRKTQRFCFNCKLDGKCEPKKSAAEAGQAGSGSGDDEDDGPTEKCFEDGECVDVLAEDIPTTPGPNGPNPPPPDQPAPPDKPVKANDTIQKCLELKPKFKCFMLDELAINTTTNKTKDCGKPISSDENIMEPDVSKCNTDHDPPEECRRHWTGKEKRKASCSPLVSLMKMHFCVAYSKNEIVRRN